MNKEMQKILKQVIQDYVSKNRNLFYGIGFNTAKKIDEIIKQKLSGKEVQKTRIEIKDEIIEAMSPAIDAIKDGFIDGIKDKLGIAIGSVAGISTAIFFLGYLIGKKSKK